MSEYKETNVDSSIFNRFSNWFTAKKVIAQCLRFKRITKAFAKKESNTDIDEQLSNYGPITLKELQLAETAILRDVQREHFKEEILVLKWRVPWETGSEAAKLQLKEMQQSLSTRPIYRWGWSSTRRRSASAETSRDISQASSHHTDHHQTSSYCNEAPRKRDNSQCSSWTWLLDHGSFICHLNHYCKVHCL